MNKKKICIIAIVLFLCLGTFVFANPSEDRLEEKDVNNISSAINGYDDNTSNTKSDSDYGDDYGNADATMNENSSYDNYSITNGNTNTYTRSNTNNGLTSNNNGANQYNNIVGPQKPTDSSGGNSNSGNSSNNPQLPSTGDNTGNSGGGSNVETPSEQPVDYSNIKNLVASLQSKVINAKGKSDIDDARTYRDSQNIVQGVANITDTSLKKELQTVLNEVNKILNDQQKPVITGIKDGTYTKENVTLNVEDVNLKSIILNGSEVDSSSLVNLSQEGIYNVVVIDSAFNQENITFTIDKTAPIATVSTSNNNQVTNKDVVVSIVANEALKKVKGWTLSSDKKTLTKTFSNNTAGVLTIEDLAGNSTKVSYKVENVDKEVPVVDANNIKYSTTELTNGNVVVTITSSKPILTPVGWEIVENPYVFSKVYTENAEEKVILRDIYGNQGSVVIKVNNIDRTAPDVVVETSNNNELTNKNVTVSIKANECLKGLDGWILSNDKKTLSKVFGEDTVGIVTIMDIAGNTREVNYQVMNIDKEILEPIVTTSNNGQPTNKDVTVTITFQEVIRPVSGWTLSADKKSISKIYQKNINSFVTVIDLAGNSKKVTYKVVNIDKEAPTVSKDDITYEINEDGNIVVTIRASKPILTPTGWKIIENPYVFSKVYSGDINEKVVLRDIYGNQGSVSININKQEIMNQQKQQKSQNIIQKAISSLFRLFNLTE